MGKVEKIVVLSVLFLIVLILAISLNTSGGGPTGLPDTQDTLARLIDGRDSLSESTSVDPQAALENIGRTVQPRLREEQPSSSVSRPTRSEDLALEPDLPAPSSSLELEPPAC